MTPEAAGKWCDDLDRYLRGSEVNLTCLANMLCVVLRDDAWRRRRIRTGEIVECQSFREFLTAPPLRGCGEDPDRVQALIRDDADALRMFREATTARPGHPKAEPINGNIIPNSSDRPSRGTAKAYTLIRLHKARPDLYAEVVAGHLTAHRAAITAGIRRQPTAYEQAQRAAGKVPDGERAAFLEWLRLEWNQ